VSLDILREAFFLWMIPLPEALSIAGIAAFKAASEAVLFFSATAFKTDLIFVLMLDFAEVFLSLFFSLCLLLFTADLCVNKKFSSFFIFLMWEDFLYEINSGVKLKKIQLDFSFYFGHLKSG
jgi:hypothetical protein